MLRRRPHCPCTRKLIHRRNRVRVRAGFASTATRQPGGETTESRPQPETRSRASHAAGCRYCQAHTIRAAERYGAAAEQLEHIWEYRTHPTFTEAERAALDLALAAATVPNGVDEELQRRLRDHWNEGGIVEILGVVSLFGYLNRWNDSMATTLEEGAQASAEQWLASAGWERGKHR